MGKHVIELEAFGGAECDDGVGDGGSGRDDLLAPEDDAVPEAVDLEHADLGDDTRGLLVAHAESERLPRGTLEGYERLFRALMAPSPPPRRLGRSPYTMRSRRRREQEN